MTTHRTLNAAELAFARADSRLNRHLAKLHRIAKANACKGDIFIGWDIPTLRSCLPAEYNRLVALQSERRTALAWVRWFVPMAAPSMEFAQ